MAQLIEKASSDAKIALERELKLAQEVNFLKAEGIRARKKGKELYDEVQHLKRALTYARSEHAVLESKQSFYKLEKSRLESELRHVQSSSYAHVPNRRSNNIAYVSQASVSSNCVKKCAVCGTVMHISNTGSMCSGCIADSLA